MEQLATAFLENKVFVLCPCMFPLKLSIKKGSKGMNPWSYYFGNKANMFAGPYYFT